MRIKDIEIKKMKLKNGMQIVLSPNPNDKSVSFGVFVKIGASYETKKNSGISHLLEHLCFNGTKKRPDNLAISSAFEELGATYNAFTDREYTGYFAKVAPMYFKKVIDIIADIYINSELKNGFNKEKKVVVEEINMYEDNPRSKVHKELLKLLYADSPIGRDIAGTKKNVLSMTQKMVKDYRNKHYTAKNTLIVISGNIDIKETKQHIKKYFSSVKNGNMNKIKDSIVKKSNKKKINIVYRDLDQIHISLGTYAYKYNDEKNYPLSLTSIILGGASSSRLYQKIRNELGAAYYIYTETETYSTHGYFTINAGISKNKLEKVIKIIFKQIESLKKNGPTKKELEIAKKNAIGHLLLARETSQQIMFSISDNIIQGNKIKKISTIKSKLKAVTEKDIKNVANEIFAKNKMKLSIVGPVCNKNKIKQYLI